LDESNFSPEENRRLQLNPEPRTVTPSVPSGNGFALDVDLLCMKPKPFGFHRTKRTNNHVEQGDAVFFTRDPIGVTDDQLPAMLANTIHNLP
jgi:hypothetical protein